MQVIQRVYVYMHTYQHIVITQIYVQFLLAFVSFFNISLYFLSSTLKIEQLADDIRTSRMYWPDYPFNSCIEAFIY